MAHRYWKASWSMGYVGTESEEEVDLCSLGYSEHDVEEMSEEKACEEILKFAFEQASQDISADATPVEETT